MYYIAQPPPLVGGSLVVPGALTLPASYGDQNEFGYRTTAGMGAVAVRTGLGTVGALASGTLYLSFFRACKPATLSRWDAAMTTTAFVTPSLVRGALYAVDSLGNLTLAASSPSDTTLGTTGNVKFGKAFTAPVAVEFARWYAWGFLVVTPAGNVGTMLGSTVLVATQNVAMLSDPRMNGIVSGQADLPASVAFGSIAASNQLIWAELS